MLSKVEEKGYQSKTLPLTHSGWFSDTRKWKFLSLCMTLYCWLSLVMKFLGCIPESSKMRDCVRMYLHGEWNPGLELSVWDASHVTMMRRYYQKDEHRTYTELLSRLLQERGILKEIEFNKKMEEYIAAKEGFNSAFQGLAVAEPKVLSHCWQNILCPTNFTACMVYWILGDPCGMILCALWMFESVNHICI